MVEFRRLTPDFSAAPQLAPADLARAADQGFRIILNNRPDGEAPGQPPSAEIKAAAEALGLRYVALPFTGPPPPALVAATADLLATSREPVLAYCRTGTRSVTAWALAQALLGAYRPDELVALAAGAGYDLSGAVGALNGLAPRQ